MNNYFDKFKNLRQTYSTFIFENYEVEENMEQIHITYHFSIPNLANFSPELFIWKKNISWKSIHTSSVDSLIFHIGLIELISYWKCACPKQVIIQCGSLNQEQINWFKKLYFYGLGEFFFTNGIQTSIEDFMDIICEGEFKDLPIEHDSCIYEDTIIPVGGGKDSVVTLELLKNSTKNYCLLVNPKDVSKQCAYQAGYEDNRIIEVKRVIAPELLKLNNEGFLNGHTPFSSLLAFLSYLIAFLTNKKYITLSNESSANESNVVGEKINHQYSKSYEFENDFFYYTNQYFHTPIQYFSFLRPLNELQIAMIFSQYEKYHPIFKSCNLGSKSTPWKWCCHCPKCLFVYIILSPFLYQEKLVSIFGQDLFEEESLLHTFIELTGNGETKPFECVGTYEEVNYAISKTISTLELKDKKLPYLLNYYKEHYVLSDLSIDLTNRYQIEHNLPEEFNEILKKEVFHHE